MVRKSKGLTDRHQKIIKYLLEFQDEHGYPPTIREIGEYIGVMSTSQVTYYLKKLEAMGHIERDQHTSRSIRVPEGTPGKPGQLLNIPLLGRIVAGEPIPVPASDLNYFDEMSTIDVARSLFSSREKMEELFALEVQGDSMIDAMINDGDIVIMKPAQDANNGEMVAVWLDDENTTTLKYFYKEKGRVRLQPANPTMEAIFVENPDRLRIMGKVVMVMRQVSPLAA